MKFSTIAAAVLASTLICLSLGSARAQVNGKSSSDHSNADRVLFAQAQKAIRNSNYSEARALLSNLIDTYPASDLIAQAKLSIADAWYSEGDFKQAEMEYRDFVRFFPNRREVAYAQQRIDSTHQQ